MQEKEIIENEDNKLDDKISLNDILESEEFQQIYLKMHTPWKRIDRKINRNEICPLCNSGKKFKNCECYKTYINSPKYTISYGKVPANQY